MRDLFSNFKHPRTTRERLKLKGIDLEIHMPDGQEISGVADEGDVVIVRPDLSRPSHSPDFATVTWNGVVYTLTPKQRLIVALLWKAWEDGNTFLSGAYLLERADSDQSRMSHVFRGSPAWRTLVVPGELHGGPADTYCLAPERS